MFVIGERLYAHPVFQLSKLNNHQAVQDLHAVVVYNNASHIIQDISQKFCIEYS
jgi:hypothetical protein